MNLVSTYLTILLGRYSKTSNMVNVYRSPCFVISVMLFINKNMGFLYPESALLALFSKDFINSPILLSRLPYNNHFLLMYCIKNLGFGLDSLF